MKMHDQNDALSDTPKALLSLFLRKMTSCLIYQMNMSIAIELHSPFFEENA